MLGTSQKLRPSNIRQERLPEQLRLLWSELGQSQQPIGVQRV